jgi:hypothetical protein
MLILKEENSYLKGTEHQLPPNILSIFKNIANKYVNNKTNGGYRKAVNVVNSNGLVTMEWLKDMKTFFNEHPDSSDIDFVLGGGQVVKNFIENKLKQLTASTPTTRAKHTNDSSKIQSSADNLSGSHGEKQSSSLSMSKSLMSNVMPKQIQVSSVQKETSGKIFVVTEDQLKTIVKNKNILK